MGLSQSSTNNSSDDNVVDRTFQLTVNGKRVKPTGRFPRTVTLENVLRNCEIAEKKKGILLKSTNPKNAVPALLNNSFVGCLWDAYSNHYKLVLRPDDLWLTIAITFADYVDNHAEEMRKSFVAHDGKKQLIVVTGGTTETADWSAIISKFSNLIDENTIGEVRDWIEPKFTTTTSNDSLIARVALMGAMKNYFSYGCYMCCGIPEITLKGTLQDWIDLRAKVDKLKTYGEESNQKPLLWWHEILIPIIDNFIESYKGNVNNDFWQSCANYIGGGSGPTYMSGWCLAFSPFEKGRWRLNNPNDILSTGNYGKIKTNKFKSCATVEVPLTINDNGSEYEAYFYAGGIVNRFYATENTMTPSFDFAVFKVPDGTISDRIDWTKTSKLE